MVYPSLESLQIAFLCRSSSGINVCLIYNRVQLMITVYASVKSLKNDDDFISVKTFAKSCSLSQTEWSHKVIVDKFV